MRWMRTTGTVAALLAGALVLSTAPAAQAGGTIIYHTGEDVFESAPITAKVAEEAVGILITQGLLTEEDRAAQSASLTAELTPMKVGWRCSIFGVFYAYFHWWGCEQVLYKWTGADTFEYMPTDMVKFEAHIKTQVADADELNVQMSIQKAVIEALEKQAGGKKLTEAYPLSSANMGFWKKNGRWVFVGIIVLLIVLGVLKMTIWKKKAPPPPAGGFPPPANYPPPGANYPPPGAPPANYPPPSG
jgi:hypothetical protein